MSDRPRIGALAAEWQVGMCCYSHDEQSVACLQDATWHGIARDYRGMEACDEHKPIMLTLAQWLHQLEPACSLPDSRFVEAENRCHAPWGDADVAELAAERPLVAAEGGVS